MLFAKFVRLKLPAPITTPAKVATSAKKVRQTTLVTYYTGAKICFPHSRCVTKDIIRTAQLEPDGVPR